MPATTIECPSNHVCLPPVPNSQAIPVVLVVGVVIGILGRSIGRGLRFFASTVQKNLALANATPFDDWALTVAKLLEDDLPGEGHLNVEAVAKLIKSDPTVVADLVTNADVRVFRSNLKRVSESGS